VHIDGRGQLSGDELRSYLIIGSGAGTEIGELLAFASSSGWLVVRSGRTLRLLHAASGAELDLRSDTLDHRDDGIAYGTHRTLSFDHSGRRLLYVKRSASGVRIVVRDLVASTETEFDPGTGELWRAEFDPTGHWLVARMIPNDTNGNGRLEWPVGTPSDRWRCRGPIPRFDAWTAHGDAVELRVTPLAGGTLRAVPGLVAPCGPWLLVRDDKNALYAESGATRELLSRSACGARVVHADCSRGALLVACSASKQRRPPLELLGKGFQQPLALDLAPGTRDRWPEAPSLPRYVPITAGAVPAVIDFEQKRAALGKPGDVPLFGSDAHALFRRGSELVVWNRGAGERKLGDGLDPVGDLLRTGGVALVAPFVVDLERGELLGRVNARALALATSGHVLVATGRQPDARGLALGPLSWQAPAP
jgi:hypothetical protein